ncbi:hypothetical protein Poli38472_008223 [Pythium oligandrum]|uniref:Pirin n=1 Tax=Pythium oligandrum TaxID=41045 RepID=A0A8K1FK29_PYTOL|nr:hypothetical protein Poli38472_008223 [Pythium oligandrum]|eukprot:TMW65581.1 hypothetical protein Poli38472_008223 [Pythium oligandrum]
MRAPDLCDAAPVIIPSRRGHTVLVVELFVKASPSASFRKFQSSSEIGEPASESFFQTDTMFRTRQIAFKFVAKEQSEGVGARVRRSIGSHKLRNLDPFLMLDEFNVGLPGGFPDHPHRGFETVTYVLPTSTGHMLHEDFLGNKGDLRPGDLQWMTPGSGIVHAEMPATTDPAHGLQLWINLPKARKTMPPKYQEVNRESVPHVFNDDKTVEAIVFAGEVFGQKGPIETEAPVTYIHFIMKKDSKLEYRVPEGHNTFVYTLKGDGVCAGQEVTAHEAIVMEVEGEGVEFSTSSDEGVEFIVMSGQPLNEPVVQYGPFVMTTKEEIHQTIYDYQSGKNGFENAPVWESEIKERRYSY